MPLRRVWEWLRFASTVRDRPIQVRMFTRAGCHLCDDALRELKRAGGRHNLQMEIVDVDQSEELRRLHGEWVPVVEIAGKIRFRGRVNAALLERTLFAERNRRTRRLGEANDLPPAPPQGD